MINFQEKLLEIISQILGLEKEKLDLETDFYGDLNLSHVEVVDLILACQQKFNIVLHDQALNEIKTIGDLYKTLEESSDEI